MPVTAQTDWWPERLLQRHPVNEVVVCGRKPRPPHHHELVNVPRLEIPLSGCYENQMAADGRLVTVQLRPGTALFAPGNCWKVATWRSKVLLLSFLFGPRQLGISMIAAPGGHGRPVLVNKLSLPRPVVGPLPHVLRAMLELSASREVGITYPELTRAVIQCVKILLLESSDMEITGHSQGLFERACLYLQGNYQSEITRASVARKFGVTPNHLSRLFQTNGSITFSSYLTQVRMDRARHLLGHDDLKLDEIAARCGYCDTPYFCRVFKRITKTTPATYRVRVRHDLEKIAWQAGRTAEMAMGTGRQT